eukprot:TRINITY_DN6767_c0_g1_i1.p1 TRINITY_DN6767_c0_g1~~TRINITY_DN6767_c0_g1_i1.p1  ORF type:complete len:647 (-),score=132.93 TRINITY_DN6767_c0_g1_i1:59-1711(-)
MNERVNEIANWAVKNAKLKRGNVVALLMKNRPEFIFTWLAMAKIGVVTALINTNLQGISFKHVLTVSGAEVLIYGPEVEDILYSVENYNDLFKNYSVYYFEGKGKKKGVNNQISERLDTFLERESIKTNPEKKVREGMGPESMALYIFTSGTTNLPKPCRIAHKKLIFYSGVFSNYCNFTSSDRIYVTLPVYHTNGCILPLSIFTRGGAIVLREKFSAKNFFPDCKKYGCTAFMYIGELCRYLYAHPQSETDKDHPVRIMIGNGLRGDLWKKFKERFSIKDIMEFYGSTEGNVGFINIHNKPGSVGQIPNLLKSILNAKIIKIDLDTEEHIKQKNGFLVECDIDETGEAIGKIETDTTRLSGGFDGYTNKEATEKKILRDVFEKGDCYFRTGDLMHRDKYGFYYFVDRIGDSFRWKGENVATSEIEAVVLMHPDVQEVTVYGVQIPGREESGRCGMATLVLKSPPTFDLPSFASLLEKQLPAYAIPLFLRVVGSIGTTATYKHNKAVYRSEAFKLDVVKDPLYFFDSNTKSYVPFDQSILSNIVSGEQKL